MKTLYLQLLLLLLPVLGFAQLPETACDNPTAQADLDVNGVRARITNGGDLWWDGQDGRYEVTADANSPNVNPVSAIFAGGFWLGSLDPAGGIRVAAQQYDRNWGRFDYYPGPLRQDGATDRTDCSEWDRLFPVYQREVREFLTAFNAQVPLTIGDVPANIAGWPATGNPYFEGIYGFELPETPQGMAPFWDEDLDGLYDPLNGDYPLFCGDQAIWCVFNDAGNVHRASNTPNNVQAEIHLLAYAFASDDSILHRTTFYDYKIINRGQEDLIDLYAGHWVDSDLGCFTDDQMGSSPEHNLYYIYNRNGIDTEPCDLGIASYGNTAPVNIFQVVSSRYKEGMTAADPLMRSVANIYLDQLIVAPPEISSPIIAEEYYNLLLGKWSGGVPITRGGIGFNTDGAVTRFAFDGGEHNGAPWRYCTESVPFGDVHQTYATGPFYLQPGAVGDFTLAVTTIFGVDFPDGTCPATTPIFAAAEHIKQLYDDNCGASLFTATETPRAASSIGLEVFPNPTAGVVTFRLPAAVRADRIVIMDLAGRTLFSQSGGSEPMTLDLRAKGLRTGAFLYRLQTNSGEVVVGRVVLME